MDPPELYYKRQTVIELYYIEKFHVAYIDEIKAFMWRDRRQN